MSARLADLRFASQSEAAGNVKSAARIYPVEPASFQATAFSSLL